MSHSDKERQPDVESKRDVVEGEWLALEERKFALNEKRLEQEGVLAKKRIGADKWRNLYILGGGIAAVITILISLATFLANQDAKERERFEAVVQALTSLHKDVDPSRRVAAAHALPYYYDANSWMRLKRSGYPYRQEVVNLIAACFKVRAADSEIRKPLKSQPEREIFGFPFAPLMPKHAKLTTAVAEESVETMMTESAQRGQQSKPESLQDEIFYEALASAIRSISSSSLETPRQQSAKQEEATEQGKDTRQQEAPVEGQAAEEFGAKSGVVSPLGPFAGVDMAQTDLRRLDLSHANLKGANLQQACLEDACLLRANLQDAELWGANLQGAYLWHANLQDANLQSANLQDANLAFADMQGASLGSANLQDANLVVASMQRAFLQRANLQGAELAYAKLQGAFLWHANLQGAKLPYAKLQDASLFRANLQGVYLNDANLTGAALKDAKNLDKAYFSEATTLPDGSMWKPGTDLTKFTKPKAEGKEKTE